jgi:hypothetical protein
LFCFVALWSNVAMQEFNTAAEIPPDCVVAPTIIFAPRPGAKPVGRYDGNLFYRRADVSNLLSEEQWRERGRKIKAGEKPLAQRGAEPLGVYADWQSE